MNPSRFSDEIDYYVSLLEKFDRSVNQNDGDLDTFISKEIIEVMGELKQETINVPLMQDIAKNCLIILLSFYHDRRNEEYYRHFSDLNEAEQLVVKQKIALLT
ncbi:MAG: hypothetical protein ACTSYI_11705 [Promethearchaeota archaeon]